jgi:hypothetical protein
VRPSASVGTRHPQDFSDTAEELPPAQAVWTAPLSPRRTEQLLHLTAISNPVLQVPDRSSLTLLQARLTRYAGSHLVASIRSLAVRLNFSARASFCGIRPGLPGIEQRDLAAVEVGDVSRNDGEIVNPCAGRDEAVDGVPGSRRIESPPLFGDVGLDPDYAVRESCL